MSNLSNLAVGDRVGIITSGRRNAWASEAVITKMTAKQILAVIDGAQSAIRFDRANGHAIERHRNDRLVPLDDEYLARVKTEQQERNRQEAEARDAARAEREARFGLAAIAGSDERLLGALHELAKTVLALEAKITARLSRVTPRNLYQELSWLQQSAPDSAALAWWESLLAAAKARAEKGEVRQLLDEHREYARSKLLQPYSNLDNIDARAELLAAREVHDRLSGLIKYSLNDNAEAETVNAVLNATMAA